MYKSIDKIEALRKKKIAILEDVYDSQDPDDVCERQKALGSMAVTIYRDVSSAVMPVFKDDGVGIIWPNISIRLKKLSFIEMPTAAEIQENYKKSLEDPVIVNINGESPKPGTKIKMKVPLPAFLAALAAQGIAIPLFFNIMGVMKLAWVKAICVVNAVCMVIEVINYFDMIPEQIKNRFSSQKGEPTVDYEAIYTEAIKQVYEDNIKTLNDWFDSLKAITIEEIEKELKTKEG